jgi:hypothetical protein
MLTLKACFHAEKWFRYHLNAPYTDSVPDVQHTVSLLDHLDRIEYYDPEWPCLHDYEATILVWERLKKMSFAGLRNGNT